jgi:hypothetical protein
LPLEFPTISLGEVHTQPTTMLFRNLMAMDTEEMIRAQPMDAVVLLVGCDKTTPAALMDAASTMASVIEALGMTLPGNAAIPAVDVRRMELAEQSGRQAVRLARNGLRPSDILTDAAFENAIRVCMATGGLTNAVIHLIAIAGRLGIPLPLERFDALSRQTPWLVNLKPSGQYQMEELFDAGGIPAVMKELAPLLRPEAVTVTGTTVGERLEHYRPTWRRDVIAPLAEPLGKEGGTVVLRGNLCPDGAVLKQSAASSALLVHRGRAVVFCSIPDMRARIDAPRPGRDGGRRAGAAECPAGGGAGHAGGGLHADPGEAAPAGSARHGAPLRRANERHLLRHNRVACRAGKRHRRSAGPGAGWRYDRFRPAEPQVDVGSPRRRVDPPPHPLAAGAVAVRAGYRRLYQQHVLQAPEGCDFDFLRLSAGKLLGS